MTSRSAVLLVVMMAACRHPRVARHATANGDLDPVRFVTPHGDTVTPIEDLRIGALDGPGEYAFGYITSVGVDHHGRIDVFDNKAQPAQRIREYDSAGKWIRDIGRDGSGPGEYSPFIDMVVLANDDVLIGDQTNARMTRFGPDGKVRASYPESTDNGRDVLMPTPDGGWFAEIDAQPVNVQSGWIHTFRRYRVDGTAADTVPPPPEYVALAKHDMTDGPTPYDAISPNGVQLTASRDQFNFFLRRGAQVDTIRRDLPRVRYSALELRTLIPAFRARARRAGQDPRTVKLPEFEDSYRWVDILTSGQIWAQLITPAVPYDDRDRGVNAQGYRHPIAVDLFTEAGTPIGRLLGAIPFVMRGDTIWGMVKGSSDEEYVVRWRLPPAQ